MEERGGRLCIILWGSGRRHGYALAILIERDNNIEVMQNY
jgi:hypothetical protein